jgi:hypothetical protein
MRAILHRNKWLTYVVLGFFLLATSGTAISRMTCLSGGHSVVSLGKATACCPQEAAHGPTAEVRAACCELTTVQAERDNYLPDHNYYHFTVVDLVLEHFVIDRSMPEPVISVSWLGSRPPPLAATDRLAVISVQRV